MIQLLVNGAEKNCPRDLNLIEALEFWQINPRLVAVEYNGEILHRQFWATTKIRDQDRLEIVTIVGGG